MPQIVINPFDQEVEWSEERFNYDSFIRQYTSFRISDIGKKKADLLNKKLQLPTRSTIHLCHNFDNPNNGDVLPDFNISLLEHESFSKTMSNTGVTVGPSSMPFPVPERFILRSVKYAMMVRAKILETPGIRFSTSDSALRDMKNNLHIKDYTYFNNVILFNQMTFYKKFEFLMRNILNYICNDTSERHHYIYLPIDTKIYQRNDFQMMATQITRSLVSKNSSFSFYLQSMLCSFAKGFKQKENMVKPFIWDKSPAPSTSLLSRLPFDMLDCINFIIYINNKAILYNLGQIYSFRNNASLFNLMIKHFIVLKGGSKKDLIQNDISSIDNFDVPSNDTEEKETEEDEFIGIRPDIKASGIIEPPSPLNEDDSTDTSTDNTDDEELEDKSIQDILKDINDDIDKEHEMNILTKTSTSDKKKEEPVPTQIIKEPSNYIRFNKYPRSPYVVEVEQNINKYLCKINATKGQIKRAVKLAERQMDVELNGIPLGDLLVQGTPTLKANQLDFLEDQVPEKEMLSSSILQLDKSYIETMYKSDLAKVLTYFSEHGMFVYKITENATSSVLDKRTEYTIHYVDVETGKSHPQRIILPTIDERGNMQLNGISSTMIKQMVNIPICKVSEYRVNLLSNYNKTIVERIQSKTYGFTDVLIDYLTQARNEGLLELTYASVKINSTIKIPYEYSLIMNNFSHVFIKNESFTFDYNSRFSGIPPKKLEDLKELENKYGVFFGVGEDYYYFCNLHNVIYLVNKKTLEKEYETRFISLINKLIDQKIKLPKIKAEYAQIKILDKNFPLVLMLAYHMGLQNLLDYFNFDYVILPKGKRNPNSSMYDIKIPFNDCTLIFNRYPLQYSLIFSGLCRFKTSEIDFLDMGSQDAYYRLLMAQNTSINYLKGITNFFDLFMDPITKEVLRAMNEPTNVTDLLIRAVEMVSTTEHYPSNSMHHHRIRGYERFPSIVYNELSRALSSYKNASGGKNNKFSINPDAVFLNIIQDSTILNNDTINPIYEERMKSQVTFSGKGGRTSRAFVKKDRALSVDAIGIASEATPDNGKVGMTFTTTFNPRILDLRGRIEPNDNNETPLSSAESLSIVGNLMPGLTQDDTKRVNACSTQLSHHVPCEHGDVLRVRTGVEKVIAHHCSDSFAYSAKENGKIIDINDSTKTVTIKYDDIRSHGSGKLPIDYKISNKVGDRSVMVFVHEHDIKKININDILGIDNGRNFRVTDTYPTDLISLPSNQQNLYQQLLKRKSGKYYSVIGNIEDTVELGKTEVVEYGKRYTSVSGSYLEQDLVVNVKLNEKVKRGDVITYNKGFFVPDPVSKQVSWKHGVIINAALMVTSATLEDGGIISKRLSELMKLEVAHSRPVVFDKNTAIYDIATVGTHLEVTDPLCSLVPSEIDIMSHDAKTSEFLNMINKTTPTSESAGEVVQLTLYYSGELTEFHKTVQSLTKQLQKHDNTLRKVYDGTDSALETLRVIKVPDNNKIKGIEFIPGTVVLEFIVKESITAKGGDKLCVMNANKLTISNVKQELMTTLSGVVIDFIVSTDSIFDRIVSSVTINGTAGRVLKKVEEDILSIYFD